MFVLCQNKKQQQTAAEGPCPVADSQLTSGLLHISSLLEDGGVCGIPTDTVYALAASCKQPQAIQHIYNIKASCGRNLKEIYLYIFLYLFQ